VVANKKLILSLLLTLALTGVSRHWNVRATRGAGTIWMSAEEIRVAKELAARERSERARIKREKAKEAENAPAPPAPVAIAAAPGRILSPKSVLDDFLSTRPAGPMPAVESPPSGLLGSADPLDAAILLGQMGRPGVSFDYLAMVHTWERDYGIEAVAPLAQIARDRAREETHRYIAFMSAIKLGGAPVARSLASLRQDRKPLVRMAVAFSGRLLEADAAAALLQPLLHDRALIVRAMAVESADFVWSHSLRSALADNLSHPANWNGAAPMSIVTASLQTLERRASITEEEYCRLARLTKRSPLLARRALNLVQPAPAAPPDCAEPT
jgi:hypothetical protein